MAVLALVAFVFLVCPIALAQPPVGKEFAPKKKLLVKTARYLMLAMGVAAAAYTAYSMTLGVKPPKYTIDTPYAIELKTDGHRLLGFSKAIKSQTLLGDDAAKLMEAIFGDSQSGKMLSWNTGASWSGQYTAKVYYSENAYQKALNHESPDEITRNSPSKGRIYRFTIYENGSVYCDVGAPEKPIYSIKLPRNIRKELFP
ncbi:MAG: hypothetical protein VB078_05890 [Clostridiaceae bacterium]|nr:hypothetical protein [Clostridiaceae bacterium]